MDRIEVETKVSEDDFVKVNYFFLYYTKMIWVLSLVGVLTIVFVTLGLSEIYGLPIGLAMIFLFPAIYYFTSRKNYRNSPTLSETITYVFNDDVIEVNGQTFKGSFTWDNVYKVKETKSWILLYQKKNVANIIPKRNMTGEDVEMLVEKHRYVKNEMK